MFISKDASRARQREAQKARDNRAEIVKALSQGQISRRELVKWGILTAGGALAFKNGLSQFAPSAYAAVPTGTPRSPLFGATKFSQRMTRLDLQQPTPITRISGVPGDPDDEAGFPATLAEPNGCCRSYHTNFSNYSGPGPNPFGNPVTNRGPMEGRPPGDWFAHQRWSEFFPKVGYVMSLGPVKSGVRFHPSMQEQNPNSVWSYGRGKFARGSMPPPLIKGRYGEPILTRIYNNLPVDRALNGGFGRNESQLHFHNAHNGAESEDRKSVG